MHIVIIGAGITGLSTAWFLKMRNLPDLKITILEKSNRTGGWIQTINKDGFLFELGPHSIRMQPTNLAAFELACELGLANEMIFPDPTSQKRFIYCDQQLQSLPSSFMELLFSPWSKTIFLALWKDLISKRGHGQDESIDSFCKRRFGAHATDYLIDALVTGIYAGDMRELSILSCFPQWLEWEQQHGSVLKGYFQKRPVDVSSKSVKHPFFSFKNGLQTLTNTLERKLQSNICLSSSIKSIRNHGKKMLLDLEGKMTLEADKVISTVSMHELSSFISGIDFPKTKFASVITGSFGFQGDLLRKKGFGHLIPRKENEQTLGIIYDSTVFTQQNGDKDQTRLTVMLKGQNDLTEDKAIDLCQAALSKQLGIHKNADSYFISFVHKAIPQYYVGYQADLNKLTKTLDILFPNLHCIGTAFNGVSINDCVKAAHAIVDDVDKSGRCETIAKVKTTTF